MTGDPDDTLGGLEPGYGQDTDEDTGEATPGQSAEEPVTDSGEPSSSPAGGAGSPPNQGIAEGEPNPSDPDGCPECTTSTTAPQEPRDDSGDGGYTTPRPGQEDVRAREWESAEVAEDDVTVTVTWWSGVEPCTVLDHVDVVEQADKVVITLHEGNAPGDEGACAAIAMQKRTRVTLSAPLGGRTIVDGAKK